MEVTRMLAMKAIVATKEKDLVVSSIYTVAKKCGKRRPVINLRWVNSFINRQHFKMSTMKDVKAAMSSGCYMATVDLKDCFWALPVCERDQKYLAFEFMGMRYKFLVLPFGLGPSPLFITKLYRTMVEYLQARGHRLIIYIDDILILGQSAIECANTVQALLALLKELGAVVNYVKSNFTPMQEVEYLGFILESHKMVIRAPPKKISNMMKALKHAHKQTTMSARQAASLMGKLGSMADALLPCRVHTSALHDFKLAALRWGWDCQLPLPAQVHHDLKWWITHLVALNGRGIIPPAVDYKAATDASDYGWGAWIQTTTDLISWGGLFTWAEATQLHINQKELMAILFFLQSSPISLRHKVVDIGVDNTTALSYVRKLGGRHKYLAQISDQVFHFLMTHHTVLLAYHLPGEMNTLADHESRKMRKIHSADLKMNHKYFKCSKRFMALTQWTRFRQDRTVN